MDPARGMAVRSTVSRRRDWTNRLKERWPALEREALSVVGIAALIVAFGWFAVAVNPDRNAQAADDFRPFAAALGLATAVAGALAVLRRREDLVVSVLGGLTGASFAVATALATLPETKWTIFTSATLYGSLLLGVLAFRGGFGQSKRARTSERDNQEGRRRR